MKKIIFVIILSLCSLVNSSDSKKDKYKIDTETNYIDQLKEYLPSELVKIILSYNPLTLVHEIKSDYINKDIAISNLSSFSSLYLALSALQELIRCFKI